MSHTDYRTLIDRGRKAGLSTAELYQAMSAERTHDVGTVIGRTDCNGYVPSCGLNGRPVFHPGSESPRS